MCSHHSAVHEMNRPVELTLQVSETLEFSPDTLPDAAGGPATKAAVEGGPFTEPLRSIPPGCACPQHPEDAADNGPMVEVRTTQANAGREEGDQALPLSISDFFSAQQKKIRAYS